PYELIKADSEDNPSPEQPPDSSKLRSRWDIDASQKQQLSPEPPLSSIQQTDSAEIGSFSSAGGTTDHKDTDYRLEVPTTVRLSPPPPLCNFKQPPGYSGVSPESLRLSRATTVGQPDQHVFGGPDQLPPPRPEVTADPGRNEVVPHLPTKELISCDLCEVELSNGQELEEHLDGKTHWDTLEYIQKHNNYDDMAIAFLQDVMMYKSRKSSRAIEDTALQALQEYDHMTKVEMFHCAACNAFVTTSAEAVQNHITSQGHMTNTKEFEARQRRSCLDKANTMMKELMPQFMSFAKGASPFK
uniref:C2H2-type domain-containing protein n=1 Tax=Neogobius melanostomus TaxID=47308 RepID=A0A8C6TZN0_9GOBI